MLKERRVELGKELSEIAKVTCIRERYLKAIEEEDFLKLPVSVYTKGYIREYARFLGTSGDEAIASYERFLNAHGTGEPRESPQREKEERREASPAGVRRREKEPALRRFKEPGKKPFLTVSYRKSIVWVALLFAVILIYALIPRAPKETQVPDSARVLQMPVQTTVQEKTGETDNPGGTSGSNGVNSENPGDDPSGVQTRNHVLSVAATDRVWLQVVIDGIEKRETILREGERVSYEADKSFAVKIGNAGGIRMKYDGKVFENLGAKGQVIHLLFPEQPPQNNTTFNRNGLTEKIIPSSEASRP